jgi:hypothetical protein
MRDTDSFHMAIACLWSESLLLQEHPLIIERRRFVFFDALPVASGHGC